MIFLWLYYAQLFFYFTFYKVNKAEVYLVPCQSSMADCFSEDS